MQAQQLVAHIRLVPAPPPVLLPHVVCVRVQAVHVLGPVPAVGAAAVVHRRPVEGAAVQRGPDLPPLHWQRPQCEALPVGALLLCLRGRRARCFPCCRFVRPRRLGTVAAAILLVVGAATAWMHAVPLAEPPWAHAQQPPLQAPQVDRRPAECLARRRRRPRPPARRLRRALCRPPDAAAVPRPLRPQRRVAHQCGTVVGVVQVEHLRLPVPHRPRGHAVLVCHERLRLRRRVVLVRADCAREQRRCHTRRSVVEHDGVHGAEVVVRPRLHDAGAPAGDMRAQRVDLRFRRPLGGAVAAGAARPPRRLVLRSALRLRLGLGRAPLFRLSVDHGRPLALGRDRHGHLR